MIIRTISLLLIIGLSSSIVNGDHYSDVINRKVDRMIDVTSQLVTITCRIVIENSGKTSVDKYLVSFDDNHLAHLSFIEASLVKSDKSKVNLLVSSSTLPNGKQAWSLDLSENKIAPGSSLDGIEVEAVFTHILEPYPNTISQSERQLVLYNGNHYFFSPYLTKSQTTKVKLASGSIESYTKLKPSSTANQNINYGPYENIAAFTQSKLQVHYENNSPFLTVSKLDRNIHLSIWSGVISIEEVIDIHHDGAKLRGAFSRYEFQREPTNGISSIKTFRTKLPPSAYDVYYRDEIGNISTSNLRNGLKNVIADLRPRFPLFGGWKTHYVIGYSLPLSEYLSNEGDQYSLRIPFVDHIFDNAVIDEATINIILPEGATDVKLNTPYSVIREKDQIHMSFLDTIGEPKIVLRKSNLVEDHIQNVKITFTFNATINTLQKPILFVISLIIITILTIIILRLDFSLTKNPGKESSQRVSSLVESVINHHAKRTNLYAKFDQTSNKFKTSKDDSAFQTAIKQISADLKQESQSISDLVSRMKSEGASHSLLDKINELQRLDKELREQLHQQRLLVEKLVSGKVNKSLYLDTDLNITKKKAELAKKMVATSGTL